MPNSPIRFKKRYTPPADLIRYWWTFLFLIVLMNFWRLVFLVSNHEFLEASKWDLYLQSFVVGIRLDAMVASYLMLPLLVVLIIKLFITKMTPLRTILNAYLFLVTLVISLVSVVDLFVFGEFDTHLNFLTLNSYLWQKDSMAFIFEEYPVWPAIAGLLLFSGGVFALYWHVSKRIKGAFGSTPMRILYLSLSIIILGTSIRGGWQERPIDWGYAMFSSDLTANQTALNSLFFFGRSVVQFSSEGKADELTQYYDTKKAFRASRQLLEDPGMTFVDEVSMTRKFDSTSSKDYNVILIILESHTAAFTGYLHPEEPSVTPHLDRMAREGIAYTNCFANGVRSAHGISSIIMSWPNLPGLPLISRTESVNQVPSLGSALKRIGYSTHFMYGGDAQFDNMNGFMTIQGYDQVIERSDFSPDASGTQWGIYDHAVFNRTLEEMDKATKPTLLTLFTTTNHQPWEIPPEYEAIIPAYPDSLFRQGKVHRSMAYVDQALGDFMNEASQRDWFDKSIFVFIADHGLTVYKSEFAKLQNAHIPFVIYAPGLALEPQTINQPVSQIDVVPTVLGLIDYPQEFTFFGQNTLSKKSGLACKVIANEAFWVQDDYFYFERFGQETALYKIQSSVENARFEPVSDVQLFNQYQKNFRSYLQTASTQFKTFGNGEK
ncbi:MAG: sulfatase-like hydrolase/transferase [Candidatus Marinimicrobia bacterium]|nr:sulfatase-like hydrolase/transferase [Candidatus Neomarinimicrobiota bacterium]